MSTHSHDHHLHRADDNRRMAIVLAINLAMLALTALLVWDTASPIYTLRNDATVTSWTLAALDAAADA